MTRIEVLAPGATREEILRASRLSDLVEVACEGAEIASLLQRITEEEPEGVKRRVPLSEALSTLSGVIMDYFRSVQNYAENMEQLEENQ